MLRKDKYTCFNCNASFVGLANPVIIENNRLFCANCRTELVARNKMLDRVSQDMVEVVEARLKQIESMSVHCGWMPEKGFEDYYYNSVYRRMVKQALKELNFYKAKIMKVL